MSIPSEISYRFQNYYLKTFPVYFSFVCILLYILSLLKVLNIVNMQQLNMFCIVIFSVLLFVVPSAEFIEIKNKEEAIKFLETYRKTNNKEMVDFITKFIQTNKKMPLVDLVNLMQKNPEFQKKVNKVIQEMMISRSVKLFSSVFVLENIEELKHYIKYPFVSSIFEIFGPMNADVIQNCFTIPATLTTIMSKFQKDTMKSYRDSSLFASFFSMNNDYKINKECLCYEIPLPLKEQRLFAEFIISFKYKTFHHFLFIGRKFIFQSMLIMFLSYHPLTMFNYILNAKKDPSKAQIMQTRLSQLFKESSSNKNKNLAPFSMLLEASRVLSEGFNSFPSLFKDSYKLVNILYVSKFYPRYTEQGLLHINNTLKVLESLEQNIPIIAYGPNAFLDTALIDRFSYKIIDEKNMDLTLIQIRRDIFRCFMFFPIIKLQKQNIETLINEIAYFAYEKNIYNIQALTEIIINMLNQTDLSINKILQNIYR